MIIFCPHCESNVDAEILCNIEKVDDNVGLPINVCFLKCPVCGNALLSYQELKQINKNSWDFGEPSRLWPSPEKTHHHSIPVIVKVSLEEAEKCFRAHAYYACAVMCGRAIESICLDHGVKNKSFARGLAELKEKGIIDTKLYQWSEALRKHRNIAAHASAEKIHREDAEDLLDFAFAISEYLYVLTAKFDAFVERAGKSLSN